MNLKNNTRLWITALLIVWGFDLLFWKQEPGISFAIFVGLCLLGGLFLAFEEKLPPARASLLLLVPILFFSIMTFLREEPNTSAFNVLLTLVCMGLLALTFRGGKWLSYSLSDMVMGVFRLAGSALGRPIGTFGKRPVAAESASPDLPSTAAETPQAPKRRSVLPLLRGLVLALPVVAVLAALLASADPIFSKQLEGLLTWIRIENLPEYIFRLAYILVGGYLLVGVFLHALTTSREEKLVGMEKPWLPPFLGWTEAIVILAAVDLLFAFFVGVQFRYFFGGQANITLEGFTYAEYARRGFGELVAVAFLSLLLFFGLGTITRREAGAQRSTFSVLGMGLVALVAVILVSAFQRLLLYEDAYGFSRIRTQTHVFMIWLGALLVATLVMEILRKPRWFGLAALTAALGFGVTLNLLNMDAFIVRENVKRAQAGAELDMAYLVGLSDDSIPQLVSSFNNADLPQSLRDDLGGALACRTSINAYTAEHRADLNSLPRITFPGYHISRARAASLLASQAQALKAYPTSVVDDGIWQVTIRGEVRDCYAFRSID
ncbi:MAG: DUF4173 domain-containing protein [Anaerolineaceae bacterium]